ncbi:MAG: hypothetical protein AAF657_31450 [Acidobacteriota bacterium]
MKKAQKKNRKLALHRETLQKLDPRDPKVAGAMGKAIIDSADPCVSCLCVSDPESVCLCSGGGVQIGRA